MNIKSFNSLNFVIEKYAKTSFEKKENKTKIKLNILIIAIVSKLVPDIFFII